MVRRRGSIKPPLNIGFMEGNNMKKYCIGARNNTEHTYSMVLQTNYKWLANLVSWVYKPFVNEVDISRTGDIVVKNNEPPFTNEYLHRENVADEYFYIWRGWWQCVGKLIYDTWNGETYSTYFPLDDEEEQYFESIYTHE